MLVVGLAIAQNPFGGDDGGFITSNKGFAKCENSVAKNLGKAAACILGCHKKRAKRSLADDTAEDNCEKGPSPSSCLGKYNNRRGQRDEPRRGEGEALIPAAVPDGEPGDGAHGRDGDRLQEYDVPGKTRCHAEHERQEQ